MTSSTGANQLTNRRRQTTQVLEVSGPVPGGSRRAAAGTLLPPPPPRSVLFLGSYLDETVLGICSSWTVPGSSSESGTVLGVFPGTSLDATIFATV